MNWSQEVFSSTYVHAVSVKFCILHLTIARLLANLNVTDCVLLGIILHWQPILENSSTTLCLWLLGCCEAVEEKWISHKKYACNSRVILCLSARLRCPNTMQIHYINTNKNLYSALIRKNETEGQTISVHQSACVWNNLLLSWCKFDVN